ncbi:MAG TPA: hypothetical protein EYM49_03100, partial [Campylobacterales bacterium]|nr:hypothetical protein [Campylobacterales bacterium]
MKKFLWLLSVVAILGLINCGGSSGSNSKEGKKLLNLIGIPQSIVVNICQDENRDGICGVFEFQAKITIK